MSRIMLNSPKDLCYCRTKRRIGGLGHYYCLAVIVIPKEGLVGGAQVIPLLV